MRLQAQREERANDELDQVEQQLADPEDAATKPSWREALAGLNWKRIAALAAAIFVAAMLIIVSFELVTGRAVSSYTGGSNGNPRTSIPGLGGGQSTGTPTGTGTPTPTPSQSSTSTSTPTSTPTATGPSPTSTSSPSSTPTVAGTQGSTPATSPSGAASSTVPTPTPAATGTPAG